MADWGTFAHLVLEVDTQAFLMSLLMIDSQLPSGLNLAGLLIETQHRDEARDVLAITSRFCRQLVRDPRDRIYALLSLADDSKRDTFGT